MNQDEALEIMFSGANVFLTGNAGTGKTRTTQDFIKKSRDAGKNVIVVAPTGIAAINIGGATIHSTFKMFGNYLYQKPMKSQLVEWRKIDTIVIDEISMVGPDYIDYIDYVLQRSTGNNLPFGGIQIIFVGDAKQLPPVYGSFTPEDKKDIHELQKKYGELIFSSAHSYKDFETLELTKVYRTDNATLITLLNRIRVGDMSALPEFQTGHGGDDTVHLKPYNIMVDKHNDTKFKTLPGKVYKFQGQTTGRFNIKNCITPMDLELKINTRVMITKNMDCGLVNGDLGHVTRCDDKSVTFYSDRLDEYFDFGKSTWKEIQYDGTEEIVIGTFSQIPLKLAWALTIHKCIEENQLVKTTDGLIKMKDLKVGQIVDTGFSFKPIIAKEFTGNKNTRKIITRSGGEIITTNEHRLLAVVDNKEEYIEVDNIHIGNYLVMNRTINLDGNDIEIHKPLLGNRSKDVSLPDYIDNDLSYLIGLLIGDGCYSYIKDGRIDLTSMDESVINFTCSLLDSYNINSLVKEKKGSKAKAIIFTSKMFREFLFELGLDYITGELKSIPDCFLMAKGNLKSNLLKGLYDTDGSISKIGNIRYVSTSKKLIDQIKLILLDFGIVSYITKMNKYSDNHNQAYTLNISGSNVLLFKKYIGFNIEYKQSKLDSFITKGKSSVDFVINRDQIIQEFKDAIGGKGIKGKGYRNDSRIKKIFSCKNLSYTHLIYLDAFAKTKGYTLPILNKTLDNNFYYDEIIEMEHVGIARTYDIEVEGDHSFICQGYVSHNSQGLSLPDVCVTYVDGMSTELIYVGLSRCTSFEKLFLNRSGQGK